MSKGWDELFANEPHEQRAQMQRTKERIIEDWDQMVQEFDAMGFTEAAREAEADAPWRPPRTVYLSAEGGGSEHG